MAARVRGVVLHCSRFGCVVRLEGGRFGLLPASDEQFSAVRRAAIGRQPELWFAIADQLGRHVRLRTTPEVAVGLAPTDESSRATSLEQKIIDYLRQTADWDPSGSAAERALISQPPRADRLLPFEMRARRQYRESRKRPRRSKR